MKLESRFSEYDYNKYWVSHPFCAKCGSNVMCSLHHILGTSSGDIKHSIMLCHDCHKLFDSFNVVGGVKGKEMQEWAINYTAKWISQVDSEYI